MPVSTFVTVLFTFWLVQLMAVISPGPSLLVVIRSSMAISRRAGYLNALGFAVGSTIWAVVAALGLSIVFSTFPWVYLVVKVVGGLYLLYLASRMFRGTSLDIGNRKMSQSRETFATSFMKGLVVQISNPKVVIFMGSIMTSLLPPSPPLTLVGAVILVVFLNELFWYAFVAYAFSIERIRLRYARAARGIDRAAGLFLGGLGLRLLVT